MTTEHEPVEISVVVPLYDESDSIPLLLKQIRAALDPLGRRYEVILVDDGSTDGSWEVIQRNLHLCPRTIALKLGRNYGQTAALMAGIDRSRGEIVVTIDGDLQNDPADIPKLIAKIEEGHEIVTGWRRRRRDKLLARRLPSLVANWILRKITGIPIHDQGCALKAYRGRILRSMSLYSDFHRFVVPLTQMGGARVAEVETNHRRREYGRSKYGMGRTLRVAADMATLLMITRFSDRLLYWFLLFAIPPLAAGLLAFLWTTAATFSAGQVSLLVPIGSVVLLFQTVFVILAYGLLAERIRHLAPSTRRRGSRLLATLADLRGGTETVLMIRNRRATALAGVPQPRAGDERSSRP